MKDFGMWMIYLSTVLLVAVALLFMANVSHADEAFQYEVEPDLDHQHLIYGPIFKPAMDKAVSLAMAYDAMLRLTGEPRKYKACVVVCFDTEQLQWYAGPGCIEPNLWTDGAGRMQTGINIVVLSHDFVPLGKNMVVTWYISVDNLYKLIERGSV